MLQEEYSGYGSIINLRRILSKEVPENIFLVTGKDSYEKSGAKRILDELLREFSVTRFYNFSSSPQEFEILRGFKLFNQRDYNLIIGIGGGSVIDTAKAIKLFHYQDKYQKIPLVAIPTTAGSGSEATHFIVYYKGKEKQSKGISDITLPEYVILDPTFTLTLSRQIAASSGIDALSQAIESYWSINSNQESKEYSRKAIKVILGNLEKAVLGNQYSKEQMLFAANLAGKAINISKTTACHAVSYPLTAYFNIPHGHACGLTLGEFLVYNSQVSEKDCNDKRGVEYVKGTIKEISIILNSETLEKARERIKRLMENIGLKTKLSKFGLNQEDLQVVIDNGFAPERMNNNPRLVTKESLQNILKSIF